MIIIIVKETLVTQRECNDKSGKNGTSVHRGYPERIYRTKKKSVVYYKDNNNSKRLTHTVSAVEPGLVFALQLSLLVVKSENQSDLRKVRNNHYT